MILVNNIPSIVSSPTFMFTDDTKIFHFVRSTDDHATLQNDLHLLHEWSGCWQLKFNTSKCNHVHFGPLHQFGSYYLKGIKSDSVESQKGLGISSLTINLSFIYTLLMLLANCLLGLIRRSFHYLDPDIAIC